MRKLLLIVCFLFLSVGSTQARDLFPTYKHILDNGMSVVISELNDNPMVSVYCLIKAGAATEGEYLGSGVSHFVEHMLFKSTETRPVGTIAKEIQAMGGDVNASTSLDFTIYTITVPADKFDEALDVLADMVTSATFDPEEVEKERMVIHREMDLVYDRPERRLSRLSFQNVFTQHAYRHPTIGYKELFDQVSRDDLYQYYKDQYIPNNMVFSVAGGIKDRDVFPKIEQKFADFKRGFYPVRMLEQEPDQVTERYLEEEFEVPHQFVSLAYQGVRLMDKDLYALDTLAHILGQGKTSRLFNDLYVDQEIVYSVSVFNFTPVDKGAFEIEMQLEAEHFAPAVATVKKHIQDIQKNGVSAQELEIAKEKIRADYVFDHQHSSSIAWSQALDDAFAGNYKFSQKYTEEISKVTNEDIQRVARQYLQDQRLSVSILKPKNATQQDDVEEVASREIQTEKIVFENGVTLLLRQRTDFPMISMRLSVEAGLRQEDQELQGISKLVSSLWLRGTKKRSFAQINEYVESKGMQLGSISGRYSLGLNLETLPDHFDEALDLFTDLVLHPTFPDQFLDQLVADKKQSLKKRDQTPYALAAFELKQKMFPDHAFGLDPKGTMESLDRISPSDIKTYYRTYLNPEHMVISVVGDFDREKILSKFQKDFNKLKSTGAEIITKTPQPIQQFEQLEKRLDKEQAVVLFGFQGPTIYAKDHYAATLAGSILGSSFSGRMFSNIRDKLSKAYTLGGGYSGGVDAGMFQFYISTTDENVDIVIDLMKHEIEDLQKNLVTDEELEVMKTFLKGTDKSSRQTNAQMNIAIHYDELYGLGYDHYLEFDEKIDAVTKEDIQRIAQDYWDFNQMIISIARPLADEEKADE